LVGVVDVEVLQKYRVVVSALCFRAILPTLSADCTTTRLLLKQLLKQPDRKAVLSHHVRLALLPSPRRTAVVVLAASPIMANKTA
jgi:hypothetical protein